MRPAASPSLWRVSDTHDEPVDAGRRPDPRRRLILGALAVVVLAAVATWLVAFSSVLGVHHVDVKGTQVLTADQVRKAADVSDGTPLIRLDTAAIKHRVELLPDVASASVDVSYPTTVVITVTERQPVGYVVTHGTVRLVDRTGDQYRTVRSAPAGLPRFVVPEGTDSRTTGGAVAVVAAALPADLRREVRSIEALDPKAITLVLTHGRVVAWGSADRSADKARVLPALLRQKSADHVDVTDPDQPFTR